MSERGSGDGGGDGAAWGCERSGAEGGVALELRSGRWCTSRANERRGSECSSPAAVSGP